MSKSGKSQAKEKVGSTKGKQKKGVAQGAKEDAVLTQRRRKESTPPQQPVSGFSEDLPENRDHQDVQRPSKQDSTSAQSITYFFPFLFLLVELVYVFIVSWSTLVSAIGVNV